VFYTYAHYTPEGQLFYIGKGQGGRSHSSKGRNVFWKRVVKKHGKPDMKVLAHWGTETEALEHEKLLISCFKDMGHQLCNLTDGGEGTSGIVPWNKGVLWSAEIKVKQGAKNIGNKHWIGRKHSAETIQKQKQAQTKFKLVGTHRITKEVIVLIGKESIKKAGFCSTQVYECANKKCKSHKGYTWVKEPLENA